MAYRRDEFAVGEWYHCYSRGVDKRVVFETTADYDRFLQALYLSNDTDSVSRGNFQHLRHAQILELARERSLVSIGAYSLMSNHFHILIQEITEGGISRFMHKVGTSYTMYFNIKNARTGNLFVKPFRSKRIVDDRYFMRIAQYIHLNAAEILDRSYKKGKTTNIAHLERQIREYRYASFPDYVGVKRVENAILDREAMEVIKDGLPPLRHLLEEASEYYSRLSS